MHFDLRSLLGVTCLALASMTLQCGSKTGLDSAVAAICDSGRSLDTPIAHRPSPITCPAHPNLNMPEPCTSDGDCGSTDVCSCEGMTRGSRVSGPDGNVCIHSNCRADSDCATGSCSPTLDADCGPFYGIRGYYCHTCEDTCTNDSECVRPPRADGQTTKGYCAYQP